MPSADQVAAFLLAHPEFFHDRDKLLGKLTIPHQRGDTISLVERQLTLLRKRNQDLHLRLNGLLSVTKESERLFERVRYLVLSVMEAQTLDTLFDAVDDSLTHDFQFEYVTQILNADLFPDGSRIACHSRETICDRISIDDLLDTSRIVCSRLREEELRFLFPDHWEQVRSTAVIPLFYKQPLGILAVGSQNPEGFRGNHAKTLPLNFIGEVLSRTLETFTPGSYGSANAL